MEYYTCHPSDKRYNAANQRYWLEYHPATEVANPFRVKSTHIIRPSPQSQEYAAAEGLRPFSQWVRLTNGDTYICGPFNFADVNGRRTRDRISLDQWKILHESSHLFTNEVPSLELPDYSIHYGQCHVAFHSEAIHARVLASLSCPTTLEDA